VVRVALEKASSVASLLVTTECVVVEKPKKEEPLPGGRPGAGEDIHHEPAQVRLA